MSLVCFIGKVGERKILIVAESKERAAEFLEVELKVIESFEQRPYGSWMNKGIYELRDGDWERQESPRIRLNHLPYAVS